MDVDVFTALALYHWCTNEDFAKSYIRGGGQALLVFHEFFFY